MKKTYSINISGLGFVIDEDAYNMLYNYLITLDEICTKAGEPDLSADIEQRIAELFEERLNLSGRTILTLRDVEEVIGRMGRPEDIVEVEVKLSEAEGTVSEKPAGPPPVPPGNQFEKVINCPTKKRLFRDTENRVFGGVCSGLGWYLGIDPVWIRIIWVVLALITGSTLAWIYVILWICVPPAKTPYQRMQMMGMDCSVTNVGKMVTGEYPRSAVPRVASGIAQGIMLVFLILALLVVGSLLLGLAAAFFGCIVALCVPAYGWPSPELGEAKLILGCIVGGALVAGIPAFLLFRCIVSAMRGKDLSQFSAPQWILLALFWLAGLAAVITCGILL